MTTDTESSEPKTRTITLTDRRPVKIREDAWPVIASARAWDNTYESQANRRWWLTVRQHEDGRTIVYARTDTHYQGESSQAGGELLEPTANLAAAIRRVGERNGCDQLVDECIADLPAEPV